MHPRSSMISWGFQLNFVFFKRSVPWAFIPAFSWYLILSDSFDSQHRRIQNSIRFSYSTDIIFSSQVGVCFCLFFSFFFFSFFFSSFFLYTSIWAYGYFFIAWVISVFCLSSIPVIHCYLFSLPIWLLTWSRLLVVSLTCQLVGWSQLFLLPRLFSKASFPKKSLCACYILTVSNLLDIVCKTRVRKIYRIWNITFWLWISRMGILATLLTLK